MESEQRRNLIIVSVLGVVAVIFVFRAIFGGGSESTGAGGAGTDAPGGPVGQPQSVLIDASAVDIKSLIQKIERKVFDYSRDRQPRDPMRPLVGLVKDQSLPSDPLEGRGMGDTEPDADCRGLIFQAGRMVVTGILWSEANPLAVVNGEIISKGYEFPSGITVEAIERSRVILRACDTLIPRELKES